MQIDRSMTEERCEVEGCNDADFLPTRCNKCHMQCCSVHLSYDSHKCKMNFDSIRHKCPLCQAPIAIPHGESADRFVSAHIDSGCKIHIEGTATSSWPTPSGARGNTVRSPDGLATLNGHADRLNFCSFHGCRRNEDVLIKCPKCTQSYCIDHRSPLDHKCARMSPAPALVPAIADPSKPLTKRTAPSQLHKRKFTNTMKTALFSEKITDGITIGAFVGDASPFYITLQRRNPIGLALDKLCKAANVINTNNSAATDADRWFVYCLTSTTGIAMEMALSPSLTVEEVAGNGDVWYVGKGATLSEGIINEVRSQRLKCVEGRTSVSSAVGGASPNSNAGNGGGNKDNCTVS